MHHSRRTRSLLLTGVAAPLFFGAAAITSAALRSDYSHLDQFISELGETGGDYAWLMNYVGFMLSAALILIFVLAFRLYFPRTPLSYVGSFLLVLFAIGVFFAGVYSCDVGCPLTNKSSEQNLHDIASLALPAFALGVAAWGVFFSRTPRWRRFGVYSLASAAFSVFILVLMIRSEASRAGTGLYQRLFLAVLFIWMIALALRLWRENEGDAFRSSAA